MTASTSLQEAAVAALAAVSELTGVFDGVPARAPFPYVSIDTSIETDWSHKTGIGREVSIAITVWDDEPERLARLSGAVERAINLVEIVDGWQLVSLRFVRRRLVRDVAGPWAAAIDFRVRLLALQGE